MLGNFGKFLIDILDNFPHTVIKFKNLSKIVGGLLKLLPTIFVTKKVYEIFFNLARGLSRIFALTPVMTSNIFQQTLALPKCVVA